MKKLKTFRPVLQNFASKIPSSKKMSLSSIFFKKSRYGRDREELKKIAKTYVKQRITIKTAITIISALTEIIGSYCEI